MAMRPLSEMVEAANAAAPAPEMNIAVGAAAPRYELYHFALSRCSQKLRATLAEAGVSYVAHDVNADPGNYHPDYIRLRLMGVEGRGFATGYTGRTAVGTEGVDPLVVPTLVDLSQERVVIDSRVICNHIAQYSAPHLVPAALDAAISHELDIIDGTPHVAMLYGAHPEHDFRPERIRKIMPGMHDRRIEKLTRLMSETADDAAVAAAFAVPCDVNRMTGTSDMARMRVSRSMPSARGITTSLMTTSGSSLTNAPQASSPSRASITAKPASSSSELSAWRGSC